MRLYSFGMIADFQELSDKIDRLAELAQALRRENSLSALVADNLEYQRRLGEAHARVMALLDKIPAAEAGTPEDAQ